MLINVIHDVPALITLEGKIAFRFVSREDTRAVYIVAGFEDEGKSIQIIDYRKSGLAAIDHVIETGSDEHFAREFCTPAWITISESVGDIAIELFELAENIQPELMLWITTGIKEPIPDYQYSFLRIEPFGNNTYSLVSIFNYRRFQAYFDGLVDENYLVENQS
ncbi:MAG: hypothetical protein WHV44_11395 [Anaerolineales bacterium]